MKIRARIKALWENFKDFLATYHPVCILLYAIGFMFWIIILFLVVLLAWWAEK